LPIQLSPDTFACPACPACPACLAFDVRTHGTRYGLCPVGDLPAVADWGNNRVVVWRPA